MIKTSKMLEEEKRLGQPLEKILPATYKKYGNLKAAAKELKMNANTLYVWLIRLGCSFKTENILIEPGEKHD